MLSKVPLSVKIIIGMVAGILLGAQFQLNPVVSSVASGFIMLLQMTALPYISVSLIIGVASLTPGKAKSTVKASVMVMLALMAICVLFIFLTPAAFPTWQNASFYSASMIKTSPDVNLVSLFIPSNPFNAFSNAVIPSVVVFSIFVGVGLMAVKGKRHTLAVLTNLQTVLANISGLVMNYAHLGIFCIGYRAAATMDISQFEALTVYLISASLLTVLMVFIVFPMLVATITPFTYRQVIRICRAAMVTAFATGSFLIVIPTMVEKCKEALAELPKRDKDIEKIPDILIPISFSLPVGGKLLSLQFALFAAWFSGAYIGSEEYASLIFIGIPQLFGTTTVAMPAILKLINVSDSMFELFLLADSIFSGRLVSLLSVSFSTSIVLLVAAMLNRTLTLKWKYLLRGVVVMPIASLALFTVLQLVLSKLELHYEGYEKFIDRDLIHPRVETRFINATETPPQFDSESVVEQDVLTRIKNRGVIRAGYFIDDLPYSFHNNQGVLVGLDIEIINMLASDLDVGVEFVRIYRNQANELLASGYLDITSGVPVIPDNLLKYALSAPYGEQYAALVVKHERRAEFTEWQKVIDRKDLTIGIPESYFYSKEIRRYSVNGKAWEITTPRLFFREEYAHIDAMMTGAASASGWTLLYPDYTVVVPKPLQPPIHMAFPISDKDQSFAMFINNWLEMKKQSGRIDQAFNYWIQGNTEG
ncbi:MAG: cation:dicarboxylase symporter family transporter [Thalassotalea sp.]|nr:cation:dicarboxylase symporter family transporter [Thalassotalea sp.]